MSKTTDYAGNMIYENGTLKRTLITGGYIEDSAYHYNMTDHLGNVRKVVKNRSTMQKNLTTLPVRSLRKVHTPTISLTSSAARNWIGCTG